MSITKIKDTNHDSCVSLKDLNEMFSHYDPSLVYIQSEADVYEDFTGGYDVDHYLVTTVWREENDGDLEDYRKKETERIFLKKKRLYEKLRKELYP